MPVTLADLVSVAEAAVGGDLDVRNSGKDIVNQAGRYLADMHAWQSRQAPTVNLSLYADQDWIDIPPGANEVISIRATNALVRHVQLTTIDKINELRSVLVTGTLDYWVAFEYPQPSTKKQMAPHGRLALYPTPTADAVDALRATFAFGWRELNDMQDVPNIRPRHEMLLRELIGAVARGFSTKIQGTVTAHVDAVEKSNMLGSLKSADGRDQSSLGPMTGGITQNRDDGVWRPHRSIDRA
jgi:hypothetical protein